MNDIRILMFVDYFGLATALVKKNKLNSLKFIFVFENCDRSDASQRSDREKFVIFCKSSKCLGKFRDEYTMHLKHLRLD